MQAAGATILRARFAFHEAAQDEVVQNAIQTLFGDFEKIQQFGHRKPGVAANEVQGPRMGSAQSGGRERFSTFSGNIPRRHEEQIQSLLERFVAKV